MNLVEGPTVVGPFAIVFHLSIETKLFIFAHGRFSLCSGLHHAGSMPPTWRGVTHRAALRGLLEVLVDFVVGLNFILLRCQIQWPASLIARSPDFLAQQALPIRIYKSRHQAFLPVFAKPLNGAQAL